MRFQHWKHEPALKVWQVASLLHGVDPDELGDIVINEDGDPLNIEPVISALLDSLAIGELKALSVCENGSRKAQTMLAKTSVLAWLRDRQYFDLADLLDDSPPNYMKKEALVAKYESDWPQIGEDLKRQASNGLSQARMAHGTYDELEVARWGRKHGRIRPTIEASVSTAINNAWPFRGS